MYAAVSLENKQTSIFEELVSQRNSDEISFFNALSQKRIVQYDLERQPLERKKGKTAILNRRVRSRRADRTGEQCRVYRLAMSADKVQERQVRKSVGYEPVFHLRLDS